MNSGKHRKNWAIIIVAAVVLCVAEGAWAGDPISGAFRLVGRTVGGAANVACDVTSGAIHTAGSIIHGAGRAVGNVLDAVVPG